MKKIIIAAIIVLVVLLVLLFVLTHKKSEESSSTLPALNTENSTNTFSLPFKSNGSGQSSSSSFSSGSSSSSSGSSSTSSLGSSLSKSDPTLTQRVELLSPYSSQDFDFEYSPELEKFLITKKTANADAAIKEWATKNNVLPLFTTSNNSSLFLIKDLTNSSTPLVPYTNKAIQSLPQDVQTKLDQIKNKPVDTPSFAVGYMESYDTYVVQEKTPTAKSDISQWAKVNNLSSVVTNPDVMARTSVPVSTFENSIGTTTTTFTSTPTPTYSYKTVYNTTEQTLAQLFSGFPSSTPTPSPTTEASQPIPLTTPSSGALQTDILSLIASYNLPPPTEQNFNGATGYLALKNKLTSDQRATWATQQMLSGERTFLSKGGDLFRYLTTAWVWMETGGYWPDIYEINCNDDSSLREVSHTCATTNFQIGGYQPADRVGDYKRVYSLLYGNTDVKTVMQNVVNNCGNAVFKEECYLDGSQANTGIVAQYLPNKTIPSSVSLNSIASSRSNFFDQGTQFYTLILGKDPNMVAALNGITIKQDNLPRIFGLPIGDPGRPAWSNYLKDKEKQLLSNMIAALYLFDTGGNSLAPVQPQPSGPVQVAQQQGATPLSSKVLQVVKEIQAACTQFGLGRVTSRNVSCLDQVPSLTSQARDILKFSAERYADLQCVGFATAMIAQTRGQDITGHGNAIDYSYFNGLGYEFVNKSSGPPQVDDLVIWSYDTYGHIAYVVQVYDNNLIQYAQANGSPGVVNTRQDSVNDVNIRGWLRKI